MRQILELALAVLLTPLLVGADGCPLTTNPGDPAATGSPTSQLDLGGPNGAIWTLSYEPELEVTLRTGNQVATQKVTSDTPLTLAGGTLDLASFCWRVDVICPHQVLAAQTVLVQPAAGQFLVSYNRKGPLASLTQAGLVGVLDGQQLSIPLGMTPNTADPCTLGIGSAVHATATTTSDQPDTAGTLRGKVTVRYSGECVTLGGSGGLYATDLLELGVLFDGQRN
jgi:hypothetical protein